MDTSLETVGYIFIVVAVLGRLWSSLFICGRKNSEIVSEGPYSIVRNPLYVFSFIGTLGIGLATESLVLMLGLTIFFLLVYSNTVKSEEAKLSVLFGDKFQQYCLSTPRFIPNFKNYRAPSAHLVDTRRYGKAFFDAMWFLWLFGLIQVIEELHELGYLPTYFYLP